MPVKGTLSEQDLINLKGDIEEAKQKVSELNGQKNALMKQLKDDFGCKDIKEAERKLSVMKTEIEKLDQEIDKGIEELSEKYNVK